jgi:DNA-binding SARP family transcriptional activator
VTSVAVRGGVVGAVERGGRISLSLLGPFELRCDGEYISLPPTAQRVLAFAALHDRPMMRPYVAGTLWTNASEERAAASLRSSLWRLHQPGHRLVVASSTHVGLAPEIDVDVRRAYDVAQRLLAGAPDGGDVIPADIRLDEELLPDWYDEWLLLERERLRQLSLHALEALAERLIVTGRLGEALEAALAALRGEPLRESAHRLLIRVHLAEGNAGEALGQYRLCRHLLRDRLGLEPSPQLDELVRPLTR